jgi:hypothetical protein
MPFIFYTRQYNIETPKHKRKELVFKGITIPLSYKGLGNFSLVVRVDYR